MTEQQTITEFIAARLDEDEATARAAHDLMDEPWKVYPEGPEEENYSGGYRVSNGGTIAGWVEEAKAVHIARHDPARVLREVEAKRAILENSIIVMDKYAGGMYLDFVRETLRHLAAAYSDHPDYNPEWSTE